PHTDDYTLSLHDALPIYRGSILPAGHTADAAYWFDGESGNFITSTYYMEALPKWVDEFNKKNLVEKYLKQGWTTLYPINTYVQRDRKSTRLNSSHVKISY